MVNSREKVTLEWKIRTTLTPDSELTVDIKCSARGRRELSQAGGAEQLPLLRLPPSQPQPCLGPSNSRPRPPGSANSHHERKGQPLLGHVYLSLVSHCPRLSASAVALAWPRKVSQPAVTKPCLVLGGRQMTGKAGSTEAFKLCE